MINFRLVALLAPHQHHIIVAVTVLILFTITTTQLLFLSNFYDNNLIFKKDQNFTHRNRCQFNRTPTKTILNATFVI